MARLTYKDIADIDFTKIAYMKKQEVKSLLQEIRPYTDRRIAQLDKVTTVFSPARENFLEGINGKYKNIDKMTRNQMIHELFLHSSFHEARTSTVKGARAVATEQDKLIFGTGPSGRPKHRMRVPQRKRFWRLYNEFLRTHKTAYTRFGSNRIFQVLGEMHAGKLIRSGDNDINTEDLAELLSRLEENLKEERSSYEHESANVFSGRRHT